MVNNKEINTVKLGDILSTSFTNGIYKSSNHYGTGVSILRITDFDNDGYLVTDDLQRVELSDAEVSNYKLQPKDIVVNRVNSLTHIGKSILWMDTKNEITVYESNMMRIKPKESVVLPEYLIKILHSHPARNHYKRVAKRAIGQSSINQQDVKSLLFFLPPLSEQQKIAKILSTWDKAISTTELLIENSTQQKKALMQQLLTGKKRLLDESGKRFEGEWEEFRLGSLFKERVETSFNDLPLVSITSSKGVIKRDDVGRKDTSSADKTKYKRICPNDIGYNTMRMWQGVSGRSDIEGIASPAYTILTPIDKVSAKFAAFLFKLPSLVHVFQRNSQGLVSDTWNLKYSNFKDIKHRFPTLKEQQKIATVLTNADKEIELLEQQLADLQQEKKALMQVLLTGKKRVVIDEDNL